VRQTTF